MIISRPYALTIAGLDPSAGAGLHADIKTFEINKVYGFGAVSAITCQNDVDFVSVEWVSLQQIINQINPIIKRFPIKYIKIGLIENMDVLTGIIHYLKQEIYNPVIAFDPILKASAGFQFHQTSEMLRNLKGMYCITPNIPEAISILGEDNLEDKLLSWSNQLNIYLKGGHSEEDIITDKLYTHGSVYEFANKKLPKGEKHGSGCVLSAALTAGLALGHELLGAAKMANRYTYQFLASNDSMLGYHHF